MIILFCSVKVYMFINMNLKCSGFGHLFDLRVIIFFVLIKTWMCGGSMEKHPCSHVGHVFRTHSPYSWGGNIGKIIKKNHVRVAEVWLDDYKRYYYRRIGYNLVSRLRNQMSHITCLQGFSTRYDLNRSAQLQQLARVLKFQI